MAIAFGNVPKEFVSRTTLYDYKTPLTEVLGKLDYYGAVILTKGKEYYGIIDDRSIARSGNISLSKKVSAGKYAAKVPLLDSGTSIAKAIHYFYNTGAKALPYTEGGKLPGIVKRDSVLKAILSMHMLSGYKTGDVMSTPLIAIDSEKTVSEANTVMRQNGINRLVVTSSGRLAGMLSYRAILQYSARLQQRGSSVLEGSLPSAQARVSDIAERNVLTIGYNNNIDAAIRELVENKVSSLLVLRGGKPVGMLTIKDIFSAAAAGNVESSEGIILSGIDPGMRQYEEGIRSEIEKVLGRLDRFTKFRAENIAVHVRKHKVRNYEIQARLWLKSRGAISASAQGYSIESTLKEVLEKIYNKIKEKKEVVYMYKKKAESRALGEEE